MPTTRIQVRRGTSAQWAAADPVLAAGEWGAAIDDGQVTSLRIGDGVHHWSDLPARGTAVRWSTDPPGEDDEGTPGDLWVVTTP